MAEGMRLDLTTRVLKAALDGASAQQRVAANNLANLETPGYTARRVRFEDALLRAMALEKAGVRTGGLDAVRPRIERTTRAAGADGNNVDIEAEMVALSEAGARYEVLSRLTNRKLEMMRLAIDGRTA